MGRIFHGGRVAVALALPSTVSAFLDGMGDSDFLKPHTDCPAFECSGGKRALRTQFTIAPNLFSKLTKLKTKFGI